jgi:branched-chain amino acid transport system substrate-binding protein
VLRSTRKSSVAVSLMSAFALTGLLAACGGGDDSGSAAGTTTSSSATSSSAASDSALGAPNKASGTPIVIGIANPGKTTSIDTTNETVAAEAAFKYANDYLGGINGHPIQIFNCDTTDTAAKQIDCANQFIQKKVAAVIQASADDNTVRTVSAAGIPVFVGVGSSTTTLTSANTFSMGNPLFVFGAPANYAKINKITKSALIVIDVPGASGPASQLGPLFFGNAGSSLKVVTVAPGTADMSPQIQTAAESDAALYYVIGDPPFCISAFKAIRAIAPKATISAYLTCIGTDKGTALAGGYAGIKTVTTQVLDAKDPEFQLFSAVMKKYGGEVSTQPAFGYAPALGLVRALSAAKITDLTSAGALAAIKSAPAVPLPLGAGATFKCDGTAVALSKNICASAGSIADTAADGTLSNYQVLSDDAIYKTS